MTKRRLTSLACACVLPAAFFAGPAATRAVAGSEAPVLGADLQSRGGPAASSTQGNKPGPGRSGQRPTTSPLLGDDRPWLGWWNDSEIRQQLGLTDDTVARIEAIVAERFRSSRPAIEQFFRERAKLNRMLSDPATTESSFELQVIKVEKLGSDLEVGRTMMLFRILRQLSPDQVRKLEEIARRRNRDRR